MEVISLNEEDEKILHSKIVKMRNISIQFVILTIIEVISLVMHLLTNDFFYFIIELIIFAFILYNVRRIRNTKYEIEAILSKYF